MLQALTLDNAIIYKSGIIASLRLPLLKELNFFPSALFFCSLSSLASVYLREAMVIRDFYSG